jgi:hypothetical protein
MGDVDVGEADDGAAGMASESATKVEKIAIALFMAVTSQ